MPHKEILHKAEAFSEEVVGKIERGGTCGKRQDIREPLFYGNGRRPEQVKVVGDEDNSGKSARSGRQRSRRTIRGSNGTGRVISCCACGRSSAGQILFYNNTAESEVLNSIEGLILQEYSIRTDPFILKISAHSFRLGEGLVASLPSGDHTDNVRVGFEVFRRGIQAVFQHKAWTALADLCAKDDEVGWRGGAFFVNPVNPVITGKGHDHAREDHHDNDTSQYRQGEGKTQRQGHSREKLGAEKDSVTAGECRRGKPDEEEGRPAGGRQYQKAIESKAHGKYDQEYESMLSHHKESIADFHGTGHRMRKTGFAAVQHRRQSVVSY